jgi:cobalt/nickel transport protein
MVLLAPLGLLLPAWFGAGSAWGEWGVEEVAELAGFVPQGMQGLSVLWHAPLPDYAAPGGGEGSWLVQSLWYLGSAVVGVTLLIAALFAVRRVIARTERHAGPA